MTREKFYLKNKILRKCACASFVEYYFFNKKFSANKIYAMRNFISCRNTCTAGFLSARGIRPEFPREGGVPPPKQGFLAISPFSTKNGDFGVSRLIALDAPYNEASFTWFCALKQAKGVSWEYQTTVKRLFFAPTPKFSAESEKPCFFPFFRQKTSFFSRKTKPFFFFRRKITFGGSIAFRAVWRYGWHQVPKKPRVNA